MASNNYYIKTSKGEKAFDYVLLVFCLLLIVITVYPFLNVLAISLNDSMDTMRNVNFIIPRKFTLSNYTYIFTENDLGAAFVMSVIRTVVGTVLGVICTAMLAYVLSRKDFYFNKPFTILFIITMYVSGGMLPEYLLLTRTLNLDGANDFTIWLKVILPLCTPTIATVALFMAVGQWNAFMDTYLYARDLPTLQYVLYEIMEQATIQIDPHAASSQLKNAVSPMSVRMAITIVATVPILVVYPFLQKYFVGGMTLGAVKD